MNRPWLLLLTLLPACTAFADGPPPVVPPDTLVYSLTVSENREEYKDAAYFDQTPKIFFEAEFTLFGRIVPAGCGSRDVVLYADSILFDSRSPYSFSSFMAVDTMYYRSRGGTTAINRNEISLYDSMLTCVFEGPALLATYSQSGAIQSVSHLKEHCPSGEYGRINLPVTFGFFLPDSSAFYSEENVWWRELRPLPSFSGVGFHPEIEISCFAVKIEDDLKTVSTTADTTVTEFRTKMKNGEDVVILNDRIRLGGTMIVDERSGITRSGEVRIWETMELLRPRVSHAVIHKNCEYTIRFRVD